MHQNKTIKEIWDNSQLILPRRFRSNFDKELGYCVLETELKRRLILEKKEDVWRAWKDKTRPQIIQSRAEKYSSREFLRQRDIEYARRATDWDKLLTDLIISEGVSKGETLVDVGGNESDETAKLPFKMTCVDPSSRAIKKGKRKYPYITFCLGDAENTQTESSYFGVYLSLRTWCVSGVLPDEALEEAKRILKPSGLILLSFPLRFKSTRRVLENAVDDNIKLIAKYTYRMLNDSLRSLVTYSAPEDYFMYGRLKE